MRPILCAAFLLISTRLFADPMVGVGCSGNGSSGVRSASVVCANGSGNILIFDGGATATILTSTGNASAFGQADYVLLITGGTGPGSYFLKSNGNIIGDGAFELRLGPNDFSRDTFDGGGTGIGYEPFVYGVPQLLHMSISAILDGTQGESGLSTISFNGAFIFDNNPDGSMTSHSTATFSLTIVPEPSFAWVVGLFLLMALRGHAPLTRSPRSHSKS